jgi:hypothetical protein
LHASRPSGPHKEPAANADGDSTKRTHADVDDRMSDVQSNSGSHREPSSNAGGSADADIRMSAVPSNSGFQRVTSSRTASSASAKCKFEQSSIASETR